MGAFKKLNLGDKGNDLTLHKKIDKVCDESKNQREKIKNLDNEIEGLKIYI